MTDLALAGGLIYVDPVHEPISGVVLIRDGKISGVGHLQVPPAVETLDCSGLTITAGFWNTHVHFFERKWADAGAIPAAELTRQLQDTFSRYGFTNVFDLGSMWANTRKIRDRIESGEIDGPRIRSTGEGLLPPGALPSDQVLNMMGVMPFPVPEIADAAQAMAASRKLLDDGVDAIKLFLSSPRSAALPESAIRAAADEAHRAGKLLFAHPNSGADVQSAIRGGVDVIAHTTPHSGPWKEPIRRRVALTPTLTLWKYYMRHDRLSVQERIVDAAIDQLRSWIASAGTVLFGTDLGAVDPDPAEEYALMAEAGLSFSEILASLTTAPADLFGESRSRGRVAEGFQADLVVSKGLGDVRYTLRDGKVIWPA